MKAKWQKSGYSSTEIDGIQDALKRAYITDTWMPKRKRVIEIYTRVMPNLSVRSSSRVEGHHNIIKAFYNAQSELEAATDLLIKNLNTVFRTLLTDELDSQT